jgi:hypothetical protein
MTTRVTLENKIEQRILSANEGTFLLSEFLDLSDRDQVLRALRKLKKRNLVIRVGQGIYVRARISSVTKKRFPNRI